MSTRYGILLRGDRVAPRCMVADGLLLASRGHDRLVSARFRLSDDHGRPDLLGLLREHRIDTMVCGGIRRELKQAVLLNEVHVIDNVAATVDEVLAAVEAGALHSGLGLARPVAGGEEASEAAVPAPARRAPGRPGEVPAAPPIDCLSCSNRECLLGRPCELAPREGLAVLSRADLAILDASMDVESEEERTLCRISELVYFCLEMGYRRIGVAFCTDLLEQSEVLVRLLRRFFEVHPVCCKIGGTFIDELPGGEPDATGFRHVACNPLAQARRLNELDVDLNVMIGLCIGVDCIFARASEAPATCLFVKDKSLVNNPVAALYSEYHLDEVSRVPTTYRPTAAKGTEK
jgi:uncharacterized metal-binding protein